jgi:hypothetical protein
MTRRYHRDPFVIENPSGPRFELALERFLEGHAFEFKTIAFRTDTDGSVCCVIDSSWAAENVTKETAHRDLAEGQQAFAELSTTSPAFALAVRGRPVRYELIHDYGNGSVLLCSLRDGKLTWSTGHPKAS